MCSHGDSDLNYAKREQEGKGEKRRRGTEKKMGNKTTKPFVVTQK